MRELKFRAWKNLGGRMKRVVITPFSAIDYGREHPDAPIFHADSANDIRDFMPDADIVEQYTGLKDENGKEIYEGDILESTWNGDKAVVVWNSVEGEWEHYADFDAHSKYGSSVVIGNIHENPELCGEEEAPEPLEPTFVDLDERIKEKEEECANRL